jgi:xanthine dehydrogenase accessory factor
VSGPAEFYTSLRRSLQTEPQVAVATIVRTRGSSPREVGARMLIRPDGATDGTVGGGCGEAEVWRAALEVLADEQPRMVVVDLTNDIGLTTDGVCGGIMDIFVEPWRQVAHDAEIASEVLAALGRHQAAITTTVVGRSRGMPIELGARGVMVDTHRRGSGFEWPELEAKVLADAPAVLANGRSQVRTYAFEAGNGTGASTAGQAAVFFDLSLPPPTLIVVGAGHVARPLAQVGTLLDFEVIVVDDRASFANKERFPSASQIVVEDFETALDDLPITPSTSVVLVTRGHAHDVRALRKLIRRPVGYIGMIGSRRRVYAVFKLLRDEGVPVDDLLKVHAPIGLDIKTETPGEIAVSIGAELLKVRRGGDAASMSDLLRPQYRYSLTRGDQDV